MQSETLQSESCNVLEWAKLLDHLASYGQSAIGAERCRSLVLEINLSQAQMRQQVTSDMLRGDPSVGDGFRIANQRLGKILGYALINATVGMVLRAIAERGLLGRFVTTIVGVAWIIATYLVVPVLVVEDIGPSDAIKRSAGALLRKTWGEQIVGNVSISVVFGLITFGLFLLGIPILMIVVPLQSAALLIAALIVGALVIIGVSLLGSALNGIYTAALYRFATGGEASAFFNKQAVTAKRSFPQNMKKRPAVPSLPLPFFGFRNCRSAEVYG